MKRKSQGPLKIERQNKQMKEDIPKGQKQKYIFQIQKPHTQWLTKSIEHKAQDIQWIQKEIIQMEILPKTLLSFKEYKDETLLQYLNSLLQNVSSDEVLIEESKNEATESDINSMNNKEKIDLQEELIFNLFEEKVKASEIANTFGISIQKVYNIKKKCTKNKQEKEKIQLENKRFIITQAMYEELEQLMSQAKNRFFTLRNMRDHLLSCFNLPKRQLALSTISKMLRKLSFSRKRTKKVTEQRNTSLTKEKRQNVARQFLIALIQEKEFIFIDETGFNQSLSPVYGYSKIGEKCAITSKFKTQNYSVVAAITKSKILGFQIFKGSITSQDFGGFIMSLFLSNPKMLEQASKYILFMDNAPIHHAKILKPFLSNFKILFNAPYSPFLNPIEEFFGNWKFNFRKKFRENTTSVEERILKSVLEIDNALLFSSFMHSLSFLRDSLDGSSIL